jgi:quercetin dioxygenase-like cupin family protein
MSEGTPLRDETNRLNLYAREELERRKKSKVLVTAEEVESQFNDERQNSHILIADPFIGSNQKTFRFWVNRGPIDRGSAEGRTLGHRHTVEAVIYIHQGSGWSIIDGVKHPWEAGDLICVPVFAWHLHFNQLDVPLIHYAATTGPLSMYQGIAIYEDDRYPELWVYANQGDEAQRTLIPGGTERDRIVYDQTKWKPAARLNGGEPTSAELYYEQLEYAQEEEKRRRQSKVVVRQKDLKFGSTPMGRIAYAVDPRLGFHVKLLSTVVAEVPPGKRSGAHRHLYEETDFVLAGSGYAIVDDRRYDFKKGDSLIIPRFAWHQYFCTGDEPARFLVHTDRVAMESTGYLHTQQAEPADYE